MSELKVNVDPAEAGFSAERLRRLDEHFAGYVADGRLAGWLLSISRHGSVVHVASSATPTANRDARSRRTRSGASTR